MRVAKHCSSAARILYSFEGYDLIFSCFALA